MSIRNTLHIAQSTFDIISNCLFVVVVLPAMIILFLLCLDLFPLSFLIFVHGQGAVFALTV